MKHSFNVPRTIGGSGKHPCSSRKMVQHRAGMAETQYDSHLSSSLNLKKRGPRQYTSPLRTNFTGCVGTKYTEREREREL